MGTHRYRYLFNIFVTALLSLLWFNNSSEMDNLKVACWNIRGYLSSIPYIKKLLDNVDVLAISEHWLHCNKLSILNGISDTHHFFGRSSKSSSAEHYGFGRGQGGVGLFWRKSIAGFSKVSNIIHDRACVIRYQSQNGEVFYFISLYLPSQGSQDDLRTTLDEISEIVELCEHGSHVVVLGDFNGDVGGTISPSSVLLKSKPTLMKTIFG